jgi:hypothetical protein
MKIFGLWICIRLVEPETLVYDVNTKETLSKICQIHFIVFLGVLKRCFKTDNILGFIRTWKVFVKLFEIFKVSRKTYSIWEKYLISLVDLKGKSI